MPRASKGNLQRGPASLGGQAGGAAGFEVDLSRREQRKGQEWLGIGVCLQPMPVLSYSCQFRSSPGTNRLQQLHPLPGVLWRGCWVGYEGTKLRERAQLAGAAGGGQQVRWRHHKGRVKGHRGWRG